MMTLVAGGHEVRGGTVEADHAAARLAGDDVGLQARAALDVCHLDLLILEDACGVHEVLVDGDRPNVVDLGLRDRGSVDLALEHVENHVVVLPV